MTRSARTRPSVPLSALWLAAALLPGLACGGPGAAPPASTASVYSVRGEIQRLPDPATSGTEREIWIRHESVPEFKNSAGAVVGMESMTMPFQLAANASVEGLAVGDRVAFELRVDWKGKGVPAEVSHFHKLTPGTALEFDAPADADAPATAADAVPGQPGETPR